jgi:hypothetical protein
MEGFLKITKPMIELLEKDKMFKWMPACEASFQELKKQVMTAPVLVMPDMEKTFSIYCNALGQGVGCVLMQDGHVVAYVSKFFFALARTWWSTSRVPVQRWSCELQSTL